jgi:tetratricopeptide (TPR) repeat protein
MHQALRDRIHFERRNLIQPDALGGNAGYHLILCRNLVIYLHARARAMLGCTLAQALLPGGRLIIGAADYVPELDVHFAPIGPAASFTFIHKKHVAEPAQEVCLQDSAQATRVARTGPRVDEPAPVPTTAAEFYRRAREHYGLGNLRQAERRCRQALYLAPDYLAALELLQNLWQLHPNLRLRRALRERIRRACTGSSVGGGIAPSSSFTAEGGTS